MVEDSNVENEVNDVPIILENELAQQSEEETDRIWAAVSFVVILIVMGVPLWWKMTEVERSYFPYTEIADLHLHNITFPLQISVITTTICSKTLAADLQNFFLKSSLFKVNVEILNSNPWENNTISVLETMPEIHPNKPGYIQLIEVPDLHFKNKIVIGKHRTVYISKGIDTEDIFNFFQKVVLNENILVESVKTVISPGIMSENIDYLRKVRPSPKYDVVFTVVNPQPDKIEFIWNNELFIKTYFEPILQKLLLLSKFRIKSQWLYFVNWQQIPKKKNDRFELNQKQIPHIITPFEKKIGSGVAQNLCINFVLYITKCEHTPTLFVNEQGRTSTAILSARWGGIQLINPKKINCEKQKPLKTDARNVMQIFLAQFKSLLGLIDHSSTDKIVFNETQISLHDWEVDILYRLRILEQFTSSRITLTSLSQLLGEISNIVITDEVGNAVLDAVIANKKILESLSDNNIFEALNYSTRSFVSSEFAFTHPSLLALLYFPDDQKYAVYIPLYLPVMIPVLLSLKNIQTWLKKKYFGTSNTYKKTQ